MQDSEKKNKEHIEDSLGECLFKAMLVFTAYLVLLNDVNSEDARDFGLIFSLYSVSLLGNFNIFSNRAVNNGMTRFIFFVSIISFMISLVLVFLDRVDSFFSILKNCLYFFHGGLAVFVCWDAGSFLWDTISGSPQEAGNKRD